MVPSDTPLFVHSGIRQGLIAAKSGGAIIDPDNVKQSLLTFLASLVDGGEKELLFPAFNYDFGRSRVFNVDTDPVQVGAMAEFVRQTGRMQRSPIPFFSVLSANDLGLDVTGQINPFGTKSSFQWLIDHDATLMFCGAPLHSITFIHYVETISGPPLYRYTKAFPGEIVQDGTSRPCDFSMHVRPMGVHLDYDWPRIAEDLTAAGVLQKAPYSPHIQYLKTRALLEFWGNNIADDPLYLLDHKSLAYFEKATNGGTSRVTQEEFENV